VSPLIDNGIASIVHKAKVTEQDENDEDVVIVDFRDPASKWF
jgi:hypothetical protein